MPKCVYCGRMYELPRGLTLVGKDGTINYLCSSKCRKNRVMKRRKVRWVIKGKKVMAAAEKLAAEKKK
ncbi:MAG: 50S ribosomal protein L24e [Nanoarchaeota archaeon]